MRFLFQEKVQKIFQIIIIFLLFVFSPAVVEAATLSISPATGTYEVGDRVTLRV